MKYAMFVVWSEDDEAFIASVPQLSGCMAHGDTRQEAIENAEEAASVWLESAADHGWTVPAPLTAQDILRLQIEEQNRQQKQFSDALQNALGQIVPKLATDMAKKMVESFPQEPSYSQAGSIFRCGGGRFAPLPEVVGPRSRR